MLAAEFSNSDYSRRLLTAVDAMRQILHTEPIKLPEIVVVGDQSVGKSSVLEALSGVQLPRASNICTRCSLELRLKRLQDTSKEEFATIECLANKEIKTIPNFNDIQEEVIEMTKKLALRKYSRSKIVHLITKYIEPETAIVLHVIPASKDFTRSESRKLSKAYDPNGERQLIAVSKIDQCDGAIGEKLQGIGSGAMALRLGCVAVLNRNLKELKEDLSFDEMKNREKIFFKTKALFDDIPEDFKGSEQLVKKLVNIQHQRIRLIFPKIMEEIKQKIKQKKAELKLLPTALTSEIACWAKYNELISLDRDSIHSKVNGKYDYQTTMNEKSSQYVMKLTEESSGIELDNFISFELFVRLYDGEHHIIDTEFPYLSNEIIFNMGYV
ncbi:unnamed protein product [Didymodactylos carnosus]|uniref:Dynamin GTPase domain-containing protein n=1 Tax=Didymodactylos carnosus TaxID=1234261 RepID=A0A815SPU7_9BILA|nr:unnamed protein product [Didymodactylos carnosus]CAF1495684.1 unnamed protein product [Didymodactylos carnosus]CAF4150824.1 unnamed protein product [Didymodactylos carnosus]CAF4358173.1 unnamed protein product [Didymodactylos carnosus]